MKFNKIIASYNKELMKAKKGYTFCNPMKLKHGSDPDKLFNKTQLRMGVETELEHTNSRRVAKAISKAHLNESPLYYTKLRKAGL